MIDKDQLDKTFIRNEGELVDKWLGVLGKTYSQHGIAFYLVYENDCLGFMTERTMQGGCGAQWLINNGYREVTLEDFKEEGGEEFIPTLDEPCEVSRADDLETWFKFIPRAKYVPHYLKEECYVGDFQSRDVSWRVSQISTEHFVFRPIKVKKTWQDVAQEFIKNDPVLSGDKFVEDIFGDDFTEYHEPMKQLAKLIVENSK